MSNKNKRPNLTGVKQGFVLEVLRNICLSSLSFKNDIMFYDVVYLEKGDFVFILNCMSRKETEVKYNRRIRGIEGIYNNVIVLIDPVLLTPDIFKIVAK